MDEAAQVVENLLEENMVDVTQKKATFTSSFPFSTQYINVNCPKFLQGRSLTSE
jgi:hypothetical protein